MSFNLLLNAFREAITLAQGLRLGLEIFIILGRYYFIEIHLSRFIVIYYHTITNILLKLYKDTMVASYKAYDIHKL